MYKHILVWMLTIILLSSFVCADLDNAEVYYSLDNSDLNGTNVTDLSGNGHTGIQSGTTSGITGKINEAFNFSTAILSDNPVGLQTNSYTHSIWIYPRTITSGSIITIGDDTVADHVLTINAGGKLVFTSRDDPAGSTTITGATTLVANTWNHVVVSRNSSNLDLKIFLNGVLDAVGNVSSGTARYPGTVQYQYGERAGTYFNGRMDEIGYWTRPLSDGGTVTLGSAATGEVAELYNSGNGLNPYDGSNNFTILVRDSYTLEYLNTFNATINGTYYNTTTGTITTGYLLNESEILNISINSENYESYLNESYNASVALIALLVPDSLKDFSLIKPNNNYTNESYYNITYTEAISPTNKTVIYNISIIYQNSILKESFITQNLSYYLNMTNYNADIYNISVSAIENETGINYTHSSFLYVDRMNYIYFYDANNSQPLQNSNVSIIFPNSQNINFVTDSLGKINFSSFINLILQNGSYAITYEQNTGYVTPITFNYNTTSLPFNISYNISRTTININIYDRLTGSYLTELSEISFQKIGNFSTSSGNLSFQNITLGNGKYTIQVRVDGYWTEQRIINYNSQEDISVSFYMLENNGSTSATITAKTVDLTQTLLKDSEVNMLEYDEVSLSYISVSQGYTDSNGEVNFIIELNDKTYKFTATKTIDGDLYTASSGNEGIIFRDDITGGEPITFSEKIITLTLSSGDTYTFEPSLYLFTNYSENFNETTNISTVVVDFLTSDGSDVEMCIEYSTVLGVAKTSQLVKCVEGNSGTITPSTPFLLNRNKTYSLDIYQRYNDGSKRNIRTFSYQSDISFQENLRNYAILSPFIIFGWILIIGIGLYTSNVPLIGVLAIFLSIFEVIVFPNVLTISGAILKVLISIQVIYFGRKKEDFK